MHDLPGSASGYIRNWGGGGVVFGYSEFEKSVCALHLLHIDLFLFTFSFFSASDIFEEDPDLPNL